MEKPPPKSKVVRPFRVFHPKLPRFDKLTAPQYTDDELLARLAEMRRAWAAMEQRRDEVFSQIGEDIERLDDEGPDAEKSQGEAEQPRAPRGWGRRKDNATAVQRRAQRGRGRPKDKSRLLNDMIIVNEFECLTRLYKKLGKKRVIRSYALHEMKVMRGIPKATLYKKKARMMTLARRLGKIKKV